jgi:hypothetical protein
LFLERPVVIRTGTRLAAYTEKRSSVAVSDRGTLRGVTQFPVPRLSCDCKLLILNGEMSEWLKEHAWKLNPLARADAHQIPPTHFRFNDIRNIDVRRRVPVNDGV